MFKFRGESTIKWNIKDNYGRVHSITIHEVKYAP